MHTVKVMCAGFGLLALVVLMGYWMGGRHGVASAAVLFLPLWLAGAGANVYVGVKSAGYSIGSEVPITALVFALPATVSLWVWKVFR